MEYILLDTPHHHRIHAAVAVIASLKHVWDIRDRKSQNVNERW